MMEDTDGAVATMPPPVEAVQKTEPQTPPPAPVVKPPPKPQTLDATFNITCDGELIGQIKFDDDQKLMRGCIKPIRRKLCLKMGFARKVLDVVVLSVMLRYTKSDHFFGSFEFQGRNWCFTEVKFESPATKKSA